MAEIAQAASTAVEADVSNEKRALFPGSYRNMVPALALIAAGLLAPAMGLTTVFFASALAWTFVLWGLFFLYVALIDVYKSYEFTDDRLIIRNPFRFWNYKKEWEWAYVYRMDIKVEVPDARFQDAKLQIYFDVPGEVEVEREDRDYDPVIAQAVIDHAQLTANDDSITELDHLPAGVKGIYSWSK